MFNLILNKFVLGCNSLGSLGRESSSVKIKDTGIELKQSHLYPVVPLLSSVILDNVIDVPGPPFLSGKIKTTSIQDEMHQCMTNAQHKCK